MAKPMIMVADADEAERGALEAVLNNRFGHDYEVVPESSTDGCLATLTECLRRHVPVAMMRLLPPIVRPFNEVAARLMTLGLYSATESQPFPGWQAAAERFGTTPRTVEAYVAGMS